MVISKPIFSKPARSGLIVTATGTAMALSSAPEALLKLASGATACADKLSVTVLLATLEIAAPSVVKACSSMVLPNKPLRAVMVIAEVPVSCAGVKE